jgi:hypothetical protein
MALCFYLRNLTYDDYSEYRLLSKVGLMRGKRERGDQHSTSSTSPVGSRGCLTAAERSTRPPPDPAADVVAGGVVSPKASLHAVMPAPLLARRLPAAILYSFQPGS